MCPVYFICSMSTFNIYILLKNSGNWRAKLNVAKILLYITLKIFYVLSKSSKSKSVGGQWCGRTEPNPKIYLHIKHIGKNIYIYMNCDTCLSEAGVSVYIDTCLYIFCCCSNLISCSNIIVEAYIIPTQNRHTISFFAIYYIALISK